MILAFFVGRPSAPGPDNFSSGRRHKLRRTAATSDGDAPRAPDHAVRQICLRGPDEIAG